MSSQRQIEANRRNALSSGGPKTEAGKERSRRNALKHGLTAVTVVTVFERIEDFEDFQRAILADYSPDSFIERELVLRLAAILWRLRRCLAIETGLIQIHGQIQHDGIGQLQMTASQSNLSEPVSAIIIKGTADSTPVDIARCLLRVINYDCGLLDRIGKYEKALWRQARQLLTVLNHIRGKPTG
jgi:hypothetical protein